MTALREPLSANWTEALDDIIERPGMLAGLPADSMALYLDDPIPWARWVAANPREFCSGSVGEIVRTAVKISEDPELGTVNYVVSCKPASWARMFKKRDSDGEPGFDWRKAQPFTAGFWLLHPYGREETFRRVRGIRRAALRAGIQRRYFVVTELDGWQSGWITRSRDRWGGLCVPARTRDIHVRWGECLGEPDSTKDCIITVSDE